MTSVPKWRRSSRCDTTHCVEVAFTPDGIAVRDSKNADGPILLFSPREWDAFLKGAKDGEFNA